MYNSAIRNRGTVAESDRARPRKVIRMDARNNPIGELNQFLYSQGYDSLCAAVSAALGYQVYAIIHQNQISIEVDEDSMYYIFRAWVEYSPEKTVDLRLTVKITFDGHSYGLSVVDVFPMKTEPYVQPPGYGMNTKQNLIPDLHSDEQREREAERFLQRYCPEALDTPAPVPIRSIMEEQMGLRVITDIRLPDDASGQIMFDNGEIPVMKDEGEGTRILPYQRGDVLVDGYKALLYGLGAMNFTLAHEAWHWFAHQAYVAFHKLTGEQGGSSYNGTSKYSSADILEIQANAMASRIMMPRRAFILKDSELAEKDIHERISALASFFRVSYSATTIRLSQLGLYDFRTPAETFRVTPGEACDLYCSDEAFREMVDGERIIYTSRRYVYNKPEYVTQVWEDVPKFECSGEPYRLTEYALSHPEEAFVRFRIDHRRVIEHEADILQARSDAYLRAPMETIRHQFPAEAAELKQHAQKFEQIYRWAKGKETFSELARKMIDYRYGSMDQFHPKDTDMKRDPETREIPEDAVSPVERFCSDTLRPRQYYEKIMKGTAGQPDNSTLMSLCVGMHLSRKAAVVLFRAAGRALSGSREDMAYRYILLHLRERYIEDVNVFLDELGLGLLGAKKNAAL